MYLAKYKDTLKYPAYHILELNFRDFLGKLVMDNELSSSDKDAFLENVCKQASTGIDEFKRRCEGYFRGNKLKGTLCTNIQELNPFVRVNNEMAFISWISEIIGLKPEQTRSRLTHIIYAGDIEFKKVLFKSFLNCVAVNDSYMIEPNCLKYFGKKKWKSKEIPRLKDAHICNYKFIQWSFPVPTDEDIFRDQNKIEKIDCRAGLSDVERKIVFLHLIDETHNVRKPTLFDAEFNLHFELGGKTKPFKDCENESGFDEYVHIPNNFLNIQDSFFEIFKA